MSRVLREMFDVRGQLMSAGRLEPLAKQHRFPLALYFEGEILLIKSAEDYFEAAVGFRAALGEKGVTQMLAAEVDPLEPTDTRLPVRVLWHYLNRDGCIVFTGEYLYYLRQDPPEPHKVEIVEYIREPYPGIVDAIPASLRTNRP